MDFEDLQQLFTEILSNKENKAPYDNADYLNYTKLNHSRLNRWVKHGEILPELKEFVQSITQNQKWVLITEPWCGDAAHSVPFIYLISLLSDKIKLEIQLRDSDSEIDRYLTNGGKSIPILIIRDENNADLAVWGPRPEKCQEIFLSMKEQNLDFEQQKITLQNWYNHDQGVSIQREILDLLQKL